MSKSQADFSKVSNNKDQNNPINLFDEYRGQPVKAIWAAIPIGSPPFQEIANMKTTDGGSPTHQSYR